MAHQRTASARYFGGAEATHSPVYQAYQILHWGFIALPIIAGTDKFFMLLTEWHKYLAPVFARIAGEHTFMYMVGVIEIAAGLIVAFRPRFGGYLVAFWLWGIIINLFLLGGHFDIALRDFGLSLGALALARMSCEIVGTPDAPPTASA